MRSTQNLTHRKAVLTPQQENEDAGERYGGGEVGSTLVAS